MHNWNPGDDENDGESIQNAPHYELGADPKRDALNAELYWAWKKFAGRCRERKIEHGTRQHNFHKIRYHEHLQRKLRVTSTMAEPGYVKARIEWDKTHAPAPPCAESR